MLRASYAFSTVRLEAWTSEVVLTLEPEPFRLGALLSLGSLLLAGMAGLRGRVERRAP